MPDSVQKRVLIAEDDAFLLKILTMKFVKEGFAVDTAMDGEVALQKMRATKPDMVILDLIMPKLSGFDVLSAMRTDPSINGIPAVVLTNLSQEEDKTRAMSLGAVVFLVKGDLTIDAIARQVKEVFAKWLVRER